MKLTEGALSVVAELALGAVGVLLVLLVALAWRLSLGPIDLTPLARRAEAALAQPGVRLEIGGAALAWEGFHAASQPIDIRVTGVRAIAPDGVVAAVPSGRLTLSLAALLTGRVRLQTLSVQDASLWLVRDPAGRVTLGRTISGLQVSRRQEVGETKSAGPRAPAAARSAGAGELPPWAASLRQVSVRHGAIVVQDAAPGADWRGEVASLALDRGEDGGIAGAASIAVLSGPARAAMTLRASPGKTGTVLHAELAPVAPATLASLAQAAGADAAAIATLGRATTPAGAVLDVTLDPEWQPVAATGRVTIGPGVVPLAAGEMALAGAKVDARFAAGILKLAVLGTIQPQGGGQDVPVQARATLTRDSLVRAAIDLSLGEVRMDQLDRLWPRGAGGDSRRWITENITAGLAHDAQVHATITAPLDLSAVTVTTLTGGVRGDDLTAWWLRPVPPIEHGHAIVTLEGTDSLMVQVLDGRQGHLLIRGGSVHVTKIQAAHQFGAIDAHISGPVAEAVALLTHPRLHLARKIPLSLQDPRGQVDARLTLTLPLEDRVTFDDVPIQSSVHFSKLHLANVLDAHDLDDGDLTLSVNQDGLTLGGSATLGGLASRLHVAMDFRAGPPDQVLQHAEVSATATVAQLDRFGVPASSVASGSADIGADYEERRDGTATAKLRADLADTAFATPVGWSKAAGQPAHAEAVLEMKNERIVSVERVQASGPGLEISARADLRDGGRVLHLVQARIGHTSLHGTVVFPSATDQRTQVVVTGDSLDLSGFFKAADRGAAAPPPAPPARPVPGPSWTARISFDRVVLSDKRTLAAVRLSAQDDGLHITEASLSAGAPALVTARIARAAGIRRLVVDAADAGIALDALGIADNIQGGKLRVDASYDDAVADSPLDGTATMGGFRVKDAPAAARLLKAATLYGAVDLLRGPGVGFSRMVAPFRWSRRVLRLRDTRAVSASLGITAKGSIDFPRHLMDLRGTVVPAWIINQLPGQIPIIGRLFSPERGGGVFAATFSLKGPIDDPAVRVNPLSALAPGALRGLLE